MLKQAHLYIKGNVIGVGFRAWTKIQAKIIGVTGWVRNVYDRPEVFGKNGGVEVVIQSDDEEKINKMISLLKQGPPISRVDNIEIYFQDVKEIFEVFEIKK
ncbi:MAG: acylphosphatase [Patescibacteria group bacterium]|nr:MAG: acylphosphatase [Patescibacteria group bacterium]